MESTSKCPLIKDSNTRAGCGSSRFGCGLFHYGDKKSRCGSYCRKW